MGRYSPVLIGLVIYLLVGATGGKAQIAGGEKKLIYYGWGVRDTMYVREHWQEMEQMPFDGTGISVAVDRKAWQRGEAHTGNDLGWNLFAAKALRYEDFYSSVTDLKAAKWQKFSNNFLPVAISSSGQDQDFNWFDDARWKIILNNWRLAVTVAKQGGLKGAILDPEHYGAHIFDFREMNKRVKQPFSEYVAKVRQRGREMMEATRRIFPDPVFLCLFGYTLVWNEVRDREDLRPAKPLEQAGYGLYPAFLDGMLEAASPRAVLVDGYEFAYGFKRRLDFEGAREDIKRKAILLSTVPERYSKHVQAGFGLWLDYGGEKRWSATDLSRNFFQPDEFERSVREALDVSDRYVWIYSETPRFFLPSQLPTAYLQAIRRARLGKR